MADRDRDLEDQGLTFPSGHFALNDNYGLGEKTMLFFNEHEIACLAMGPSFVELPYPETRDLIRPESPL